MRIMVALIEPVGNCSEILSAVSQITRIPSTEIIVVGSSGPNDRVEEYDTFHFEIAVDKYSNVVKALKMLDNVKEVVNATAI